MKTVDLKIERWSYMYNHKMISRNLFWRILFASWSTPIHLSQVLHPTQWQIKQEVTDEENKKD